MALFKYLVILFLVLTINKTFSQNIKHEFRGVWIATVNNIDWPKKEDSTAVQQKEALINLLDYFKKMNFNAVVFQVRPSADAFYNSSFEPWSIWLDSTASKPNPYYDPLAFIIKETHKRGMELHAWLNPYRAVVDYEKHIKNWTLQEEKPEWFINYGNNTYFNPSVPEVRVYTTNIVADIVQKYDVDAIHFDDYFYPYTIDNEYFNDDEAFEKYGGNYYPSNINDWRRNNVNLLIKELHTTIKNIKPWVQFGISPFGVWRNKSSDINGSDTKASQTNYDNLYADVLLWLQNDWIDYIVPQVYWEIGFDLADYTKVVDWWDTHSYNANLYVGQAMYRQSSAKKEAWQQQNKTEIEKQLDYNVTKSNVKGTVYFSARSFLKNKFNINTILKEKYYNQIALPPITNNTSADTPEAVIDLKFNKIKRKMYRLSWQPTPEDANKKAVKYLVYQFVKKDKTTINNTDKIIALIGKEYIDIGKKSFRKHTTFVVIPINRNNQLGKSKFLQTK